MLVRELRQPAIRSDLAGDGKYLSSRGSRLHYGMDFIAQPNDAVYVGLDCQYHKVGLAYANSAFTYIEFYSNKLFIRYFYVLADHTWDSSLQKGDRIGTAQNISSRYKGSDMQNHVHVECFYMGEHTELLKFCGAAYYEKRDRTYINPELVLNGQHKPLGKL